jgi:hypothetical protein
VSHKTFAVGTAIIVVSLVTFTVLAAETYTALQTINPVAVIAAATVVVIGLAWFKKASKT